MLNYIMNEYEQTYLIGKRLRILIMMQGKISAVYFINILRASFFCKKSV